MGAERINNLLSIQITAAVAQLARVFRCGLLVVARKVTHSRTLIWLNAPAGGCLSGLTASPARINQVASSLLLVKCLTASLESWRVEALVATVVLVVLHGTFKPRDKG